MERIISYDELPKSSGESIYIRVETDPALYLNLFARGYKIVNRINDADTSTIYLTGKRQDNECKTVEEYKNKVRSKLYGVLKDSNIEKPSTVKFSYEDLISYKYQIPFVLKNENQNGGREKFLIATEEDYERLILACYYLYNRFYERYLKDSVNDDRIKLDYERYIEDNFYVQEYVKTPTKYCTTIRVLTSSSNDLLCALLKYKEPEKLNDNTSLLGYVLREIYPLSTKSIVSNTLSGGSNILIGENTYSKEEREILDRHNIPGKEFTNIVNASKNAHMECKKELGILCGFDYIYDQDKDKWHILEYHSRPMVGEYARRNGMPTSTYEDRLVAEGRVRATALSLTLKKQR